MRESEQGAMTDKQRVDFRQAGEKIGAFMTGDAKSAKSAEWWSSSGLHNFQTSREEMLKEPRKMKILILATKSTTAQRCFFSSASNQTSRCKSTLYTTAIEETKLAMKLSYSLLVQSGGN